MMHEPSDGFDGKAALVAAAASGLGRGTAERTCRRGDPRDLRLLGPGASVITGTALPVNGGRLA